MVLSCQKIEHGSFAILRSYGNQSSAICDRNVSHNILNSDRLTVGKKIGEKFNLSCLFMNIFRIQNRCFLRFWSWRCRRFRTKWRNKFACSKISHRCPPCCLLWFSREHNARVHMTFPLNEMHGYSPLCDRLQSSAIIWKQVSLRSSAIVCDHMVTSL